MTRLIDADALQRKICGAKCGCEYEDCGNEGDCEFAHFISWAPKVEAEPVRHGKWIWMKDHWECSRCRGSRFHDLALRLDASFCGRCGARMVKTMTRLIDADELREDWLQNGENEYVYDANAFIESIDNKPTIDAVEVVRCGDCFYSEPLSDYMKKQYGDNVVCCNHPHFGLNLMRKELFCCFGERRDGD